MHSVFKTLVITILLGTTISTQALIPDVVPGTEFEPVQPTRQHARVTQQIMTHLLRGHYDHQRLDDRLSERVMNIVLDQMDPSRSYLLAEDVASFRRYQHSLDDALNRSDLRPAFFMYNRLQQRVSERLSFLLTELKHNGDKYRFDGDETLERDREDAPWAVSKKELDQLWRKRLQNSMLNLKLAGKERKEIIELLEKRYQNQLNRIHQNTAEDGYQLFMNAVTHAFDPHTQYFSPRNTENFNINMSLSLQGIGAVLQSENEYTKVVKLVPAGPADKTGNLKPADKIIGVGQSDNGSIVDVIGWRLDEVVDLIRGPKGTTVRLQVLPSDGTQQPKVISIIRDEVKLEEQSAQKDIIEVPNGSGGTTKLGVIDIPTFYIDFKGRMENKPDYRSTTRDVRRLINQLAQEDIDGLIIDLRNNGGGSLEEAVSLTGLFIKEGPVVQVRSNRGRVEILPDADPSVFYNGPLTVLVNRLSASASEIFAGAIQDYGRGLVVGGQTFGKGTVQSLRSLGHGQLKITQAKFYRVSGDSTQHQGVIPDILFPSLFDKEKIGESALEEALPWDAIRPADHTQAGSMKDVLPALRQQHQQRIEDNPDFRYLRQQKALREELAQQTLLVLNEKRRKQEQEDIEQRQLALENERRKAKGMKLLASLDDLEEQQDNADSVQGSGAPPEAQADTDTPEAEEAKEHAVEDALLDEAGRILVDYIRLNKRQKASLTAQSSQQP
ncbi:tail-specific protease [Bacterioplanes sanyensis]|uniref:Tail-specific protease n=1 Tax=Bacterioplanes sanyensis TaxID=1249553 RepID=A0A222FPG8_9GAMM|nr:carboxy terminal-processing peptidase [Bacterioplanes sanyensis]ASP40426.1 tail-specific protease [Bacterioplanes sanyensis]